MECFHMTSRRSYWCLETIKRRPCWCPKPVLWELTFFLIQTLSFVPINLHRCWPLYRVFLLTWQAAMQMYWNKWTFLHRKKFQLQQDWFGAQTWPPFYCFETPIWPPWRHVKTLSALTWSASMQIYWNKRNFYTRKSSTPIGLVALRPFPSCCKPLFQSEVKCEAIDIKIR